MKLKTILFSLLLLTALTVCSQEKVDPQQLLKNFNEAVEANSVEQMKSLILAKEGVNQEHVEALANIYIKVLGGDLKNSFKANEEKLKSINTKKVNYLMMGTFAFNGASPKNIIPEGELVKEGDKDLYKYTKGKNSRTLLLKSEGGTTKFWPEDIKDYDGMINLSNFLNDYMDALNNTPKSDFSARFDDLVDKYVPETTLKYKEQDVKAAIMGEEKAIKFVLIESTNFKGQDVLSLNFLTEGPKEKCGKFSPKIFSISVPNDGNTSFDFARTGINGSLMKTNYSASIMVGKITLEKIDENTYRGKIAAEKDDDNYINGNFTAEICK